MGELTHCLNCGGELHGPFCAGCGQRAVPANPTVRELASEAWNEMTGYDGRIMATLRGLMRPGFLTREYLAGRRAQFLPPLRVYLIVSVIYFVIAASAPEIGRGGLRVAVEADGSRLEMTEEQRQELLAESERAAWYVRPMMRSVAEDPDAFRARMFTIAPRVFFALLPVFAGVVALFYRGRHFPTALVFAVHLHACAFVIFAISEALKFTHNEHLADRVGAVLAIVFAVYALRAFRAVYGGGWPITVVKAAGIGLLYLIAAIPAFVIIVLWTSLT
jgi:hypothetical protein